MDDLEEAAENIHILVREALDVQHQLEGHPRPIPDCPICARHAPTRSSALHTASPARETPALRTIVRYGHAAGAG